MTRYRFKDEPCISICCNRNNFYPPESNCYENVSFPNEMVNFSQTHDSKYLISNTKFMDFQTPYGVPCEDIFCYPDSNSTRNILFYLLENGTIHMNKLVNGGLAYWLGTEDYCLTSHALENETQSVSICESYFESDSFINAQSRYNTEYYDDWFYFITASLSLPFFVATFIVYTILSELKNLHGLILRTYIGCAFIMYIMKLLVYSDIRRIYVIIQNIIHVYFLLTTFFWLNVMCYDIWWTFRLLQDNLKERYKKKYFFYSCYAWGVPALIVGYLIYDYHLNFLLGCISVTVICNVFFFVSAVTKLIRLENSIARQLEESDHLRQNDEKQRFYLYLKLFIVMGTGWVFDIIAMYWDDIPRYIVYIVELPSIMQGFTMFVLFVMNVKVKRLLLKRLGFKDRSDVS